LLEVQPATLELAGGSLGLGTRIFAQSLNARVGCRIATTDVSTASGADLIHNVFGELRLGLGDVDLAAPGSVYLGAESGLQASGVARVDALVRVEAGHLEPGSHAEVWITGLALERAGERVRGDVNSRLGVPQPGALALVTTSPELWLENDSGHKPPSSRASRLHILAQGTDLAVAPVLDRVELQLPQLQVPSLGVVNQRLTRAGVPLSLGGRVDGDANVVWEAAQAALVRARLRLVGGVVESGDVLASLAGHVDVLLEPAREESQAARAASTGQLNIELDAVQLSRGQERTPPLRASLRTSDLKIELRPRAQLRGALQVSALPAYPLLSLVLGSPVLRGLAADAFELERLDASIAFQLSRQSMRFELSKAQSGELKGEGHWQSPAEGQSSGAFLVSSPLANVGLSLRGPETNTSLLVADDWLLAKPNKSKPRPQRGAGARH
jgi:hypothetical protein